MQTGEETDGEEEKEADAVDGVVVLDSLVRWTVMARSNDGIGGMSSVRMEVWWEVDGD